MRDLVHDFIREALSLQPHFAQGGKVLDIGSYDINGSARGHFNSSTYIGVDWRPGPGVDVVALAHELDFPDASFDVVLSVETLEHDAYWRETLAAMHRMLRPGGLFLITVASFNFPQHHPECSSRSGYYHNLMPEELLPVLKGLGLTQFAYKEQADGVFYAGLKSIT